MPSKPISPPDAHARGDVDERRRRSRGLAPRELTHDAALLDDEPARLSFGACSSATGALNVSE